MSSGVLVLAQPPGCVFRVGARFHLPDRLLVGGLVAAGGLEELEQLRADLRHIPCTEGQDQISGPELLQLLEPARRDEATH